MPATLLGAIPHLPTLVGGLILHHLKASPSQLSPQLNPFTFRLYKVQPSEFTLKKKVHVCVRGK